jgi:polar amino acid transport system substrate-binding protein
LFAEEAWHLITGGFYTTVIIFLGAAVFAFLLAVLLTYMGINHKWGWLYQPLHWFVFTIHDIPSVVLMMFFYYVVFASTSLSGIVVAAIALGVYTSASLTKIFKIHITQISSEQRESGLMLGLTSRQVYRYVVFPQAVRTMLPLVIAELKLLLRSTSYAGYIAQKDLVKAVDAIRGVTFDAFLPLLIVSLLYLLLSWLISKSVGGICQKMFIHD